MSNRRGWRTLAFLFSLSAGSVSLLVQAQAVPEVFSAWGFDQNRDYSSPLPHENIDPMTGNLILTHTDIVLPGNAGFDLTINRVYNSKVYPFYPNQAIPSSMDSWAGIGWSMHLAKLENASPYGSATVVVMGDGSVHPTYASTTTSCDRVTKDYWCLNNYGDAVYLNLPSGRWFEFRHFTGPDIYVTEFGDQFGNKVIVDYNPGSSTVPIDGIDRIRQYVSSNSFRELDFIYDSTNSRKSLKEIRLVGTSHVWRYTHQTWSTTFSRLIEVVPPTGPKWKYAYNSTAGSLAHELTRVITPSGGFTDYSYQTVFFSQPGNSALTSARAVSKRKTGGRAVPVATWTYAYAQGSKKNQSVFTSPCNKVTYTYMGIGAGGGVPAWQTGLLKSTVTTSPVGATLQSETLSWIASARISNDPMVIGKNSHFETVVPLVASRSVTRGGSTFRTDNVYRTTNFNDYGQPWRVTETGRNTRFTEYRYDHGSGNPYLVRKLTEIKQTVAGETFVQTFAYDSLGFKTQDNIYGLVTTYQKDSLGNRSRATDGLGNATHFTYSWGVLKNTITPQYTIQRTINTALGTVNSVKQNGHTTSFTYDRLFRITRIAPPAGTAYDVSYHTNGESFRVQRGVGSFRTTHLDGFGRRTGTSDSEGIKTLVSYDACGRVAYESFPFTGATSKGIDLEYDGLGRVTRRVFDDGNDTTFAYDGIDVIIQDENNRVTRQFWKGFGNPSDARLEEVVDADLRSWDYHYNALGSLTRVVPPSGPTRSWTYNSKNQLSSETQPESGTLTYAYDAGGNLVFRQDAEFGNTTYLHDSNKRLIRVFYPDASVIIGYDDSDNVTTARLGSVTTNYTYDSVNRMTSRRDIFPSYALSATYSYDSRDNLISIGYPTESGSRLTARYAHDSQGRITSIWQDGGGPTFASNFAYHPSGAVQSFVAGNGLTHNFSYDPNRYWLQSTDSGYVDLSYSYEANGNVVAINDSRSGMSQSFDYDELDRLTDAQGPWGGASYQYDVAGNRTRKNVGGSVTDYQYHPSTSRLASASGAEATGYSFDGNGNMVAAAGSTFAYNPRNMMTTSIVGGSLATYNYDANNLRKTKASGGKVGYYFHGPGDLLLSEFETDCGQIRAPARDYIYAGTRLVASVRHRLETPSSVSPLGASNQSQPVFQWTAVSGAASYDLMVDNVTDGVTVLDASGITGVSYTLPTVLASGKLYRWQVRAVSTGSTSCYSAAEVFELDFEAPAATTNLVASATIAGVIHLTWTAPGDDANTGSASAYDIRYQPGPSIVFDTATQASAEPKPLAAGTTQSFEIVGLPPLTPFAIAMKAVDDGGNLSSISNIATITTVEATPPEAVTDLALTPSFTSMDLHWTAPHEDGPVGTAVSGYDVRYSTSLINSANFEAATPAPGVPVPLTPGSTQVMTVSGLTSVTTYFFALRSTDDVGNVSAISSVATAETLDNIPPDPVGNLIVGYHDDDTVDVHWSATGDDGSVGIATSFDLRYSTQPITPGNFASATPALGEPAPGPLATAHRFVVESLSPNTTYYVALVVVDDLHNESPISNVESVTTYTDLAEPLMISPTSGSTLASSTQTFQWAPNGLSATRWDLYFGTSRGENDILYTVNLGSGLTYTASGLPTDGSAIWVRLWYFDGDWGYEDFPYTAFTAPQPEFVSPTPGSTLSGPGASFEWIDNGVTITEWWVYAGATPGGNQYYDSGSLGLATQVDVIGLPLNGGVIYLRLYYRVSGVWLWQDYQYTAATAGVGIPAITSPTASSTLHASTELFQWTFNGASVDEWWIYAGSTPGSGDYYSSDSLGVATQTVIPGLPVDGSPVFVRLWYRSGMTWIYIDYQYTAATLEPTMTTPAPSSTLSGSSQTFQWSESGVAVTEWWLYVGTSLGGSEIVDSGVLGLTTQLTVDGIPVDGSPVFVRLWYRLDESWATVDYHYTAGMASITSPTPSSVLSGSNETFQWSANGVAVEEWWLFIGATPGGADIFNSGSLATATQIVVAGLPIDGSTLFVTLWHRVDGVWETLDVQYAAADLEPGITSPVPGTGLPGASAQFQWAANEHPVTEWWIYVGSSPESADYYDSGSLGLQTSDTAAGLPTDGSSVYLTLYYRIAGLWHWSTFPYTAASP